MQSQRAALLALALVFLGCAEAPFRPEFAPSPERIRALLDAPIAAKAIKPTKFELRVSSPVVLLGNAVRLTCFVPESLGSGYIRMELSGARVHGPEPIRNVQTIMLVDPVDQCGPLTAVCEIVTAGGRKKDERQIEVKGGFCDGTA